MRIARALMFALVAVAFIGIGTADAQTPTIGVYFDEFGSVETKDCPGDGMLDQVYFYLRNANTQVSGVQFRVSYGPYLNWVGDNLTTQVEIGATFSGLAASWALPQNGFFPVNIGSAFVEWICPTGCNPTNSPVIVLADSNAGETEVLWTDWPAFQISTAVGLTALVCATVPTEDTTWGGIKALYDE